jgi:hypothetical protein
MQIRCCFCFLIFANFLLLLLICSIFIVIQVSALLHTVLLSKSFRREGHLLLYSGLVIGHKEKDGVQRVLSHPFAQRKGRVHSPNCQDLVFIRPPDHDASGVTMESVWFCKVLLLFTFQSLTDSGIKQHKCAFVSVLWEYEGAERPGSNYI